MILICPSLHIKNTKDFHHKKAHPIRMGFLQRSPDVNADETPFDFTLRDKLLLYPTRYFPK